jgi:hypothetical protein
MSQTVKQPRPVTEVSCRTYRLHDGDALFYFRDLRTLSSFIATLADAVPNDKVWIDTVQMSETCWSRLPNIDAAKI